MHFYKAKWEASTPTKVQINVPTNTDFMVGTELYVKGEKKDIGNDNVKLVDTVSYPLQYAATTSESDVFGYEKVSNKNTWTLKEPIVLMSNLKSSDFTTWYRANDGTELNVTREDGVALVSSGANSTVLVAQCLDENNAEICRIIQVNRGKIIDGVDGVLYYAIYSSGNYVTSITLPVGAKIQSTTFYDPGTDKTYNRFATWSYQYLTRDEIAPDTSVNGIPAFTMKSLDTEADKNYDVVFSKSSIDSTEDYNFKFKLFINEDEQSYGDVEVEGTPVFDNTISLSGVYEDDTTFSYTIPVID